MSWRSGTAGLLSIGAKRDQALQDIKQAAFTTLAAGFNVLVQCEAGVHRAPILGCPSWLLNLCLIYYVFSLLITTFSTRLRHLAKHVYTTSATMFSAFVTMIR